MSKMMILIRLLKRKYLKWRKIRKIGKKSAQNKTARRKLSKANKTLMSLINKMSL